MRSAETNWEMTGCTSGMLTKDTTCSTQYSRRILNKIKKSNSTASCSRACPEEFSFPKTASRPTAPSAPPSRDSRPSTETESSASNIEIPSTTPTTCFPPSGFRVPRIPRKSSDQKIWSKGQATSLPVWDLAQGTTARPLTNPDIGC